MTRQAFRSAYPQHLSPRCVAGKLVLALAGIMLLVTTPARGAVSLYPNVLYGGMNVVTIRASTGIERLQWQNNGRWVDLRRGQAHRNLRIVSAKAPSKCVQESRIYLFVPDVTRSAEIDLRVIECGGIERRMRLSTGPTWDIDHQRMKDIRVGETVCQPFSVRSTDGGSVVVDRVVSPSGDFELRFSGARPPVRIRPGGSYFYDVCFRATTPGRHKMPIHVYIRRGQPAGGFTSFIVADTAYITVVGDPPAPVRRKLMQPIRPKQTRPSVSIEKPARPVEPPPKPRRIPNVDTVGPRIAARAVVPVDRERLRAQPDVGEAMSLEPEVTDPTTFRTVVLPTARSIPEGEAFVGSYDLAGVLAGYGVTDRLTVFAGGLYVPDAIGVRTVDFTAGARYELYRGDFTRVAAGVQLNHSDTDSSAITLAAPYLVVSVGDDDRRASLAVSHTTRRHDPASGEPFMRDALVVAVGGDLRIGGNWKLAGEAYWIDGSSYKPFVATARYFGRTYALDVGAAINMTGEDALVAPVVSLVWVIGK